MNRLVTTASNLFRRSLCLGSARLEAGLPEEDSAQSKEGQLLHDYSAHPEYKREFLKPQQRDLLRINDELIKRIIEHAKSEYDLKGDVIEQREQTLILSGGVESRHAPVVAERQSDFNDLQRRTGIEHPANTGISPNSSGSGSSAPPAQLIIEGTPDLVMWWVSHGTILINDSKFGFNIVESAELNLQLRVYAVLAYTNNPTPIENVIVSITQPRLRYEERIRMATYTPSDIEASRQQILSILDASEKPDAPLVPGEDQCRYCKAKMICPAFKEAMMVPVEWRPDKALSKDARQAYLEQKLAECSDKQLEKVYVAERLGNMIHEPLNDEIRKRKTAGGMENFEIAKDSEVREITDVRRAISLLSLAGLEKSEIFECVTKLSFGNLETVLRKRNPNWTWQETKEWTNKKLKSVIELTTRKGRIIRNA